MVERWQQLPLDHALSRLALVHDLVQRLADEVADVEGRPHEPVPDLGPAVVIDQLRVMAHDRAAAAGDDPVPAAALADRLARLRRAL